VPQHFQIWNSKIKISPKTWNYSSNFTWHSSSTVLYVGKYVVAHSLAWVMWSCYNSGLGYCVSQVLVI